MVTKEEKLRQTLLEKIHDSLRAHFNEYTKRAFRMLPDINEPSILDIGCGTGIPTIELVNLSNGYVTAIDIDKSKLDSLTERAKKTGLSGHVKVIQCSMFNLEFPDDHFDIIWTEGSIAVIGFEKGIKEWRCLIKPNGFLVVHDLTDDIARKSGQVNRCGYTLMNHFTIPGNIWWLEYYKPLGKHIEQLRIEYHSDPVVMGQLDRERLEVEKVKTDPMSFSSTFFIMRKLSTGYSF